MSFYLFCDTSNSRDTSNLSRMLPNSITAMQVRAVQSGRVLVVDEADKAPTHVTCILKNIIGRGDVTLADGRRIVHSSEFVRSLKIFD